MSQALSGAFVEVLVVENYGDDTTETETVLDQTTEDIEVERDPEEIDFNVHGNSRTQRIEGHETVTTSFEMIVTSDGGNLQDANMLDANGNIRRNVKHDAVRIKWYANEADMEAGNAARIWYGRSAQFVFETMNVPIDDISTIETSIWIDGDHGFESTA